MLTTSSSLDPYDSGTSDKLTRRRSQKMESHLSHAFERKHPKDLLQIP